MINDGSEKIQIITTDKTNGLANIYQITDATSNQYFRHDSSGTSGTETTIRYYNPKKKIEV